MTLDQVKAISGRILVVTAVSLAALTLTTLPAAAAGPAPAPAASPRADDLEGWAEATSDLVGVPERALLAYGADDLALREECGLTWNTLAGIGSVESDHGRFGGARVGGDGLAEPLIIGLPLDGRPGIKLIPDTDGGELDGDTGFDRAVGPMQFIPTTWDRFGADADDDGIANPHDIDDAALAAGSYLCAGGRDLTDGDDWTAALFSYNRSAPYGQRVFDIATELAAATGESADG